MTKPNVLMTKTHNGRKMELTRQAGFIVTVYDEEEQQLGVTDVKPTPDEAFAAGRDIIEGKIPGPEIPKPRKLHGPD